MPPIVTASHALRDSETIKGFKMILDGELDEVN